MKASFLDLDISLKDKEFDTELYDKSDAFPFSVVRMLYRDSSMPTRTFYGALGSEILRLARTTSSKQKYQKLIANLFTRRQNTQLKRFLNKLTLGKHLVIFNRFADTTKSFIYLFQLILFKLWFSTGQVLINFVFSFNFYYFFFFDWFIFLSYLCYLLFYISLLFLFSFSYFLICLYIYVYIYVWADCVYVFHALMFCVYVLF